MRLTTSPIGLETAAPTSPASLLHFTAFASSDATTIAKNGYVGRKPGVGFSLVQFHIGAPPETLKHFPRGL